jgi:lysophospholipase L1-like esterase
MLQDRSGKEAKLPLSEKQIRFIQKNYKTLSAKEMSKQLNVSADEIESFVKEIKAPAPKWFYLSLFAIPILFFILLEAGLRIFNYGNDTRVWVDISQDMQILNPEIGYRYFLTIKNLPFSVESFIYKEKKENSFRVFVVGASSAAGYPYLSSASFSKFIRKKLEILYPEKIIEVSNFSMSAINSYTVKDLMPELLKKEPDLVLIYLGHNEYYGALGVGSLESLGSSRFIVNTTLWLNKFKTTELLRNIVKILSGIFSSGNEVTGGTMMAQMAQDKLIEYNSDIYWAGIEQFEGNLRDIFSMCKDAGVPVIASTLSSNIKDQKPFVSVDVSRYPPAEKIYDDAKEELMLGNADSAKSLFIYAKDLDALRFRAPEQINETIIRLCNDYNYPFIRSDSLLNSMSQDGIAGDNLMTDHLHPNVKGYQLIGNLFFSAMTNHGYLPTTEPSDIDEGTADSLVYTYYNFTSFDSKVADFRIKILKNDWPYINPEKQLPRNRLIRLNNIIDSLAIAVVDGQISREKARLDVASNYLRQNQFDEYATEMAALIEEFPFIYKYYNITARELIGAGKYSRAYYFLKRGYDKKPDAFNSKWLGIIDLSQGFVHDAIEYLELSLKFNNKDAQTYFNITGAYAQKKEFNKALESIKTCLQINPEFQRAEQIRQQLEAIINQNNSVE